MALHCENRPVNNLYRQLGAQHYAFTQMDGREVYKFAVRTVPKAVSEALEQAELPIEDVKYFLIHQANIRIIESVAKRLHQPMEQLPELPFQPFHGRFGGVQTIYPAGMDLVPEAFDRM